MTLNRLLILMAAVLILANAWLTSPLAHADDLNRLLGRLVLLLNILAFAVAGHRAGMRKRLAANGAFALSIIAIWLLGPWAWSLATDTASAQRQAWTQAETWIVLAGHVAIFGAACYFGWRLRRATAKAVRKAIDDIAHERNLAPPAGESLDNEST